MRKEYNTMSKNTDRPAFEPAEITVEGDTLKIKMNKDTEESAQKLSAYIRALNLTAEQNNELIAMIIEHVQDAERGAFAAGLLAAENGDDGTDTDESGGQDKPAGGWLQ